jgi:hypothetical protein
MPAINNVFYVHSKLSPAGTSYIADIKVNNGLHALLQTKVYNLASRDLLGITEVRGVEAMTFTYSADPRFEYWPQIGYCKIKAVLFRPSMIFRQNCRIYNHSYFRHPSQINYEEEIRQRSTLF